MALNPLKGVAQGIAGRALKTVAGNITDGLLGKNDKGGDGFSDYRGAIGKYSTKHLSFPIDVEAPPGLGNQGHYVIFEINKQKPPKLTLFDRQQAANEGRINLNKAKKQQGGTNIDTLYSNLPPHEKSRTTKEQFAKQRSDAETNRYLKQLEQRQTTVGIKRRKTVTLDTHISLYMPPTVQVSYISNYGDVQIGAGANIAAGAYQDYQKGMATSDIINKSLKALGPEFGDELIRKALGAVDMIPGLEGAQNVIDAQRGFVKTPQMELAFKGINKRTFQYAFTMMPKSEQEAEMVQQIVKSFKRHMLPAMTLGNVRRLNIPDTFNIKYYYAGNENEKIHKISECVLETMNVSYGGDRYKAYEDGQPVVTNLTLNFKEMDLITREKIEQGY